MDLRLFTAVLLCILLPSLRIQAQDLNPADGVTVSPAAAEVPAAEPLADALETQDALREIEGEPIQRGPIHEAFAEPLQLSPQADPPREKAPPEPIQELPPTADPDAQGLQWIPGYWGWDEQRNDYVWVSGVWRKAPKGRAWVAGKWTETDDGHRWIPGAWLTSNSSSEEAVAIQPTPPASLEEGPTSPTPSDDHFWIPGSWQSDAAGEYVWRPGFWSRNYSNWVWVPDHYSWRPSGCVYVPGYWDYTWERRGTLYAPCTFAAADLRGNVCYRPSRILSSAQWLANLWVGPGSFSYYYGNYDDCRRLGYSPWYSYYGRQSRYYDPFYSYYRWHFPSRYGLSLYGYLNGVHSYYRRTSSLRPHVSIYHTRDHHRRSRGYASLYGDVAGLSRRLGYHAHLQRQMDQRDQRVRDQRVRDQRVQRDQRDQRDQRALRDQRDQRDQRSPANTVGGPGSRHRELTDALQRRLRAADDDTRSNRPGRRAGVTRDDMGNSRAPGITRAEIGRGRDLDRLRSNTERATQRAREQAQAHAATRRSTAAMDSARQRSSFPGRGQQINRAAPGRSIDAFRNSTSPRPDRVILNPSNVRSRSAVTRTPARSSAPAIRTPSPSVSQARRAAQAARARPNVTRSAPASRPRPTVTRSAPRRSAPAASAPRATSRPSSPGFSTHGMKRARGADLARQRAAMQQRMSNRKK